MRGMNATASAAAPSRPSRVYVFATCVVDLMAPQAGMDAIALIRAAGIAVEFPDAQSCCGQPAYTSGYTDEARTVAAAQLDLFPEPWPIVVPSGSVRRDDGAPLAAIVRRRCRCGWRRRATSAPGWSSSAPSRATCWG